MKHMVATSPWVLLTLLLTTGCATMQSRWKDTESATTIEAYEDFLQRYPTGSLAAEARSKVERLYLREARTNRDLEAFLNRFPSGEFAAEVRQRLERSYWREAENKNTTAAYEVFLNRFPVGKFADEARARLKAFSDQPAKSPPANYDCVPVSGGIGYIAEEYSHTLCVYYTRDGRSIGKPECYLCRRKGTTLRLPP